MKDFTYLDTSPSGVRRYFKIEADGTIVTAASQDVTALLDHNKAARNHNDGYSPSRETRRVASIPAIIIAKWLSEEGLDVYNDDHSDRLAKKLNDPDWAYLRTADGRLGVSNGVMR